MRIKQGTTDHYVYFVAVDPTDLKTREQSLSSFTVYYSINGGTSTAMTTPTVNETDTTNMPGVYELLIDESGMTTLAAGDDTSELVLHITQASMAPVTRTIEIYREETTAGNTLDVTATGAGGIDWGNIENKTTANDLSATDIQLCDTVTTLTGHTAQTGDNYARLGAPAGASVSADIAAVKTDTAAILADTGTDGVVVASLAANSVTASALATDAVNEIVDQVWDELQSAHVTAGSFGEIATEIASILVDTAEIGTAGAGLTNINLPDQTMNITGDITGNLSGSVGSVTGAVGSVTGAVGSVTGSVGSVVGHTPQTGDTYALANGATGFAAIDTVVDSILARTKGLVIDEGTLGATGNDTTHVHLPNLTYGDDEINGYAIVLFDVDTSEYHVAAITDWVNSTKLATVPTLPFTPAASTDTYHLIGGNNALSIWDALTANHADTGSMGKGVADAGSAGDPWSTALPGAYGAGTAGNIVGNNLNAAVADVETDTQDIQSRLPAALVSGRMDSDVGAMQANTVTASALATDAVNEIVDQVWDELQSAHVTAGSFGEIATEIASILVDTAEIGTAGAGLTNINLPDQAMNITGNITGNLSGSVGSVTGAVGSVTAGVTLDATATSAQLVDDVWDEVLSGATHNVATSAGRRLRNIQDLGQYEGGAIWVDTVNGTAGVVDYENGTVNNPVDTIADALTIAASVGLKHIHIVNGSTITFPSTMDNYEITGDEYGILLNGQSCNSTSIHTAHLVGVGVSGTFSGNPHILHSSLGAVTGPNARIGWCALLNTLTSNGTGTWVIHSCWGLSGAKFDFGAGGATTIYITDWMGGPLTIDNMATGDVLYIEGDSGLFTLSANCTGGTVYIAGNIDITNNGSGQTIVDGANTDGMLDALLSDAQSLPGQESPTATPTIKEAIMYLYKAWRNKKEQTSTTMSLYDDAGTTVDQKSTVSDDGTTATRGEIASGP